MDNAARGLSLVLFGSSCIPQSPGSRRCGPGESYGDVIMRLARGGFRAALLLLLSGGINDGVAESHRRMALATPRGPPTSPRAAPNARGFFCIRPRAALFVSNRGIKAGLAESTRRVPHQRDPQTRRRNDAMAWSTPEVREVYVGMEVTSYLSAEM